jgi:hypothetical protein
MEPSQLEAESFDALPGLKGSVRLERKRHLRMKRKNARHGRLFGLIL